MSCRLLIFNCTHHGLSLVKILDLYLKMPYFIIFDPIYRLNIYILEIGSGLKILFTIIIFGTVKKYIPLLLLGTMKKNYIP